MAALTLNRLEAYEATIQAKIDAGGQDGALDTPEKVVEFERTQDIDFEEHFSFQETQAHAHAVGVLTPEAAMYIYSALGEVQSTTNGGWQPGVTLARKVTITNLMGELLKMRLGR